MKCIKIIAYACAFMPSVALANNGNAFMGAYENQVSLLGGYVMGDIKPESENGLIMAQYSQPGKMFRLDVRQNLHLGHVISSSDAWSFAGISVDAALIQVGRVYTGVGLGGFIRTAQTPRLGSRFTFGERAFVGCKINDRISGELYVQHFSNGDLTAENAGYNFIGLSANFNF